MVRETRHLWVRNLPENTREDRIREHFKRYGRVQSVKIFTRKGGGELDNGLVGCGATGMCATVSFMDIKSASKAHNGEHKLDDHVLATEYHEPAPIPSSPATPAVPSTVSAGGSPITPPTPSNLRHPPPYSSPRISFGPEDITTFDTRSSHFFERRDGTDTYVRRTPSAYVVSPSESLRGRTRERDRLYRNGPTHYTPILESVVARTPPTHHRSVTAGSWSSFESTNCSRYPASVVATSAEILSYTEDRRESPVIIVHKKHPKSRRRCRVMRRCGSNGSESVSNNSDSSRSRSHSSSSSSHSRSSSSSSDSSSAAISEKSCSTHSHHGSLKSAVTVHSAVSTPLTNCSPVVHTDDRRPLAICVRNLPARPSDNSLKETLHHEYKKYGKVTSVQISGQGSNRYAVVCFKKADDTEKALQSSNDKLLCGTKIEVTVYQGFDVDDNELRPGEPDMDEYHPKATRTLFIGNLEKDVSLTDLRNTFSKFGEIIDIDIKELGPTCYAFCQYCDISSVVKAMHAMDGEYLGINKINLGYGKSHATNCLWVAGVADCVTEKQLIGSFSQFGQVTHVHINRSQGKALVFFQQITHATEALTQMRGYVLKNRRLMADFASLECQDNFYVCFEKSKSSVSSYETNCQDSPRSTSSTRGLDTPVSTTSTNSGNVSKHCANSNNNCNSTSGSNNGNVNNCNKVHPRFQHTSSSLRTTPTRQLVQQTPSSSCASPIVNNTPSPSPSTSSRSTPHPQHTSRFDYNNTLECSSDKRLSRSLEELDLNVENGDKPPPTPHDLQKERVTLLEQLNDYSSSEDEEEELVSLKQQSAIRQRSTSCEESRPGTPLCDEKPENILAHYESRRAAKEKNASHTPLSLPLPSFANKVARSTSPERSSKSPHQSKPLASSRPYESSRTPSSNHTRPLPSQHAKDKSNILDMKLSNIPLESLTETMKTPLSEKLKLLDEKYEQWSGSRSKALAGKLDTSSVQVKHKLLDVNAIGRQRSEICESVLSRKSVFDDHFKRLETMSDQQPSSEFIPPRPTINNTARSHSIMSSINPLPNLCGSKSSSSSSSSSSLTNNISSSVMKGLQYPFPSHPPLKPAAPFPKLNIPFASSSSSTSSLSSASSLSSKPPPSPDLVQSPSMTTLAPVYASSSQRSSLLLRNNSVEKLTDLPKNTTSSVTAAVAVRESLSRLDTSSREPEKKDIAISPVRSRQNSVENMDKGSVDDEPFEKHKKEQRKTSDAKPVVNHIDGTGVATDERKCSVGSPTCSRRNSFEGIDRKSVEEDDKNKENKKTCDAKPPVNHIDSEKNLCNSILGSCRISNAENENSVLDKRKRSFDRAECKGSISTNNNNTVSVILHTSQKAKICKSTEDLSEIEKVAAAGNRRSSVVEPLSPKDDRVSIVRQEDCKLPDEKKSGDHANHLNKTKGSSSSSSSSGTKSDLSKIQHHKSQENISSKTLKLKLKHKLETHSSRPPEPKREYTSTSSSSSSSSSSKLKEIDKEKKKERPPNSHPENGKIKSKQHADSISKLLNRKDLSKERKNSSGSSSHSDSVHSKSKHNLFDGLDSNTEEKIKSEAIASIESHSKKLNQIRVNSCTESHSSKEEKKNNDLLRSKKSSSLTNVASTSPVASSAGANTSNNNIKRNKKPKKRKSLSDSSSDSEFESFDENKLNKKNHSIFDVVLDEPAYISMYDKVKARSTKNLQKQEEEKRQEKLNEKFSQLKQSRVKRAEKKRSTSYDDDSEPERSTSISRKSNKRILDSSDEDHSGNDKARISVPSDSSDVEHPSKNKLTSDVDEDMKNRLKKKSSSHRSHISKINEKMKPGLTDTSEDEIKLKDKKEKQTAFLKEAKRKFKKSMFKKTPNSSSSRHQSDRKRIESDFSDDVGNEREKSKSCSEAAKIATGKMYLDFSDEEVKSKPNSYGKGNDRSNAENKFKPKPKNNLREMIVKGELDKTSAPLNHDYPPHPCKGRLLSDVSEEEIMRPSKDVKSKPKIISNLDESRIKLEKLLSESSENEGIGAVPFSAPKKCNIYSDDSDIEVRIKQEVKDDDELFFNLAELHHSYSKSNNSPPPLINPMVFDEETEMMKKKSHKKKQKRQKSIEHSLERNKKHSKKERRKSVLSDLGEDDSKEKDHKVKQKKKKKKNRDKVKSVESLEEDIFGSMSDSSDKVPNDPRKLSKLSVSDVYDADSDSSNKDVRDSSSKPVSKVNNLETTVSLPVTEDNNSFDSYFDHTKAKKKKRKKSKEEKTKHHHHHHNHNRHHSKQESKRDTSVALPTSSSPTPPSLSLPALDDVVTKSPPAAACEPEPVPATSESSTVVSSAEAIDIVTSSIVEEKVHEEKVKMSEDESQPETKNESEEAVHQRAVQSISNGNDHERAVLSISNSVADTSVESVADSIDEKTKGSMNVEEKSGIVISQEETLVAVSTILFGEPPPTYGVDENYAEKSNSPENTELPPRRDDRDVEPSCRPNTPTEESSTTVTDDLKAKPEENLHSSVNDDSESESAFSTPCGPSPELDKTNLTTDKSKYDSALDVTVTELVTKAGDETLDAVLSSNETSIGLSSNETSICIDESSPALESSPASSCVKVDKAESVETDESLEQTRIPGLPPEPEPSANEDDVPPPHVLPNNIAEKGKDGTSESVSTTNAVTCSDTSDLVREPTAEDVKCNGPSSLSVSEMEVIESKGSDAGSSEKSNHNSPKTRPESAESCPDNEVVKVADKVENELKENTTKSEPFSHDCVPSPPLSAEKVERLPDRKTEVEVALKQKLPIPAQQNTEMGEQLTLDLVHDSCEVNEANKENIVKTIKNQENLSEILPDDTKVNNTFLRNRERDVKDITRNVDDEIFRSNDFSRCHHKTTESNRNILEKVVQRIHESKRTTIQKLEETPISIDDKVADKSVPPPADEELNNAEVLLKMNESSISQSPTNLKSLFKARHNRETSVPSSPDSRLKDVEPSPETKKNESAVVGDTEPDDETLQDLDDSKLGDHSYNAKRGRRRRATASAPVVTRRAKNNNSSLPKDTEVGVNFKTKKSSADVYEFKEDSEDEVKRPRLILTIKNPIEPTPQPVVATVAPIETASVITDCKAAAFGHSNVSIATTAKMLASTRKSRRLQEKDGIRSAVDDTIDEVIKTVQSPRPTRRTTRVAAAAAAAIITTAHEPSLRKNARAWRKPTPLRSNATQPNIDGTGTADDEEDEFPLSPTTFIPPSTSPSVPTPSSPMPAKTEPTNLIDPVSGLLIPMKEAEEGQYVPVRSDLIQSQKMSEFAPPEKKPRLEEVVEEPSALSLVKLEPTTETAQTTSVIASVLTSSPVIKCISTTVSPPNYGTKVLETTPIPLVRDTSPAKTNALPLPVAVAVAAPAVTVEKAPIENGPISLIKTTIPTTAAGSIIAAPMMKTQTRANTVNQSFPTAAHSQPTVVTKLHPSKSVVPQPRILTPITPKAHIIQALGVDSDAHSSDEIPYPSQFNSPLIHAAVASPPLTSPKISPQPATASSVRANHSIKSMVPLDPLKVDPLAGFYYLPKSSPPPRPTIPASVTIPSPGIAHHYMRPQFMYQPYMQESSLTPYHHVPSSAGGAKIMSDRGEIVETRPSAAPLPAVVASTAVVAATATPSPPPLELRKKSSPAPPHSHLNDVPLITNPYVPNNRSYYYDEAHRASSQPASRIRLVSTPPYSGKVTLPVDAAAVDIYHPTTQSRSYENVTGARYPAREDEDNGGGERLPGRRSYPDSSYPGARSMSLEERAPHRDGKLDYSRGDEIALCDSASRGSSPSQMNSPPLGDSPPQGKLDGTLIVQLYPIIWQGLLALKNDQAAVQMHVVSGNRSVAYDALPKLQDGYQPLLRIAQRMRLEQAQLDGVNRKMEIKDEHCTILGLPCGKNQEDVVQQATNLESCIIPYLQSKKAAGIINTAAPGTQQAAFVVHVFPPCEFADNVLLNAAPDLYRKVQETAYLVCIIVTV